MRSWPLQGDVKSAATHGPGIESWAKVANSLPSHGAAHTSDAHKWEHAPQGPQLPLCSVSHVTLPSSPRKHTTLNDERCKCPQGHKHVRWILPIISKPNSVYEFFNENIVFSLCQPLDLQYVLEKGARTKWFLSRHHKQLLRDHARSLPPSPVTPMPSLEGGTVFTRRTLRFRMSNFSVLLILNLQSSQS